MQNHITTSCIFISLLFANELKANEFNAKGLLFVNNKFVVCSDAPSFVDGKLVLGDTALEKDDVDLTAYRRAGHQRGPNGFRPRFWRVRQVGFNASNPQNLPLLKVLADEMASRMRAGESVVLTNGLPPVFLAASDETPNLLNALIDGSQQFPMPKSFTSSEEEAVLGLIKNFEVSNEFQAAANKRLGELQAIETSHESIMSARLFADQIGYPLTMISMVLVVLGFGHLLSNKPNLQDTINEAIDDTVKLVQSKKVVTRSLLIVGSLSLIDLTWTILASQAGSMRELNPIGNELIANPLALIAFKIGVVGMAIAILYRLHQHPVAQVASWWCCLVLTLLTARWLTFNAMFV